MSLLFVFVVILVIGLAVAIVVIKRRQDAPFRSFAETIATSARALRQKPKSIYYRTSPSEKSEVPFHPDKDESGFGEYKLDYDGVTLVYQYEKSTEFVDLTGDELTHVGIQYIQADPKEIYLDDERIEERHRYLEEHTGDMMTVRRLIRKHLKIENPST
jgi:hypothetical protein